MKKLLSILLFLLPLIAFAKEAQKTIITNDSAIVQSESESGTTLYFNESGKKLFGDQFDYLKLVPTCSDIKDVARVEIQYGTTTYSSNCTPAYIKATFNNGSNLIKATYYNRQNQVLKTDELTFKYIESKPMFTNDAAVVGILILVLGFIFKTSSSSSKGWKKFYTFIPSLLLCYFIPSILNSAGIISGDYSSLYYVSSRYLLPASLVLLTLSIDLKGIIALGPKAVIMFLSGTLGIVIGGPLTIIILSAISPDMVGGQGPDEVWKGLATIAGSWIGGGANQTAMKEMFGSSDKLFSAMITVDVIVANIWMAFLLYGAGKSESIDKFFKADTSAIETLKNKMTLFQNKTSKIPTLTDLMVILAIGLGVTGICHMAADVISPWVSANAPELKRFSLTSKFFWLIVLATTGGVILSFSKAKKYEGAGASKIGSVFIYILVASIGMKMDALAIIDYPGLFLIGAIWMLIHIIILLATAKLIKAPFFFTAVGSKANIGGAASAPIVASAFHPSLAPVGVLLAVLGYALGTYAAWICAVLMQSASGF